MILYQLIRFVAPGLKASEKKYLYLSSRRHMLFLGGLGFGYECCCPSPWAIC